MTDQEINKEIAEFTGESKLVGLMRRGLWYRPNGNGYTNIESEAWHLSPDEARHYENLRDDHPVTIEKFSPRKFTEDLNACRDAELKLSVNDQYTYGERLRVESKNVGDRGGHFTPNGFGCFALATLTARQRCEALLRVLGKWKE